MKKKWGYLLNLLMLSVILLTFFDLELFEMIPFGLMNVLSGFRKGTALAPVLFEAFGSCCSPNSLTVGVLNAA